MMWSGQTNNIPHGWALCDGYNGTPNLKDRFIVGAGASYNVGNTGGASTVKLTVNQMPSHNHANGNYKYLLQRRSDGKYTSKDTDTTRNEPDLIHSGGIKSAGGGQAHENRPPYYALAYIMKL
jgi:microcystin-dependent protein